MKAASEKSSVNVYAFILLMALELLMSFTFLGYMHIPPISITFAYIPILIAACLLGTLRTTVVGAAFGLASMDKSTAAYVMPMDMIFSPFRSGYSLSSLILSVGTRVPFGFLAGSAFYLAKRSKHPRLWIGAAAAITLKLHAVLVYIAIALLFPDIMQQYPAAFYLHLSDLIMICLCIGIAEGLWKVYDSERMCRFKQSIDDLSKTPDYAGRRRQMLCDIHRVSGQHGHYDSCGDLFLAEDLLHAGAARDRDGLGHQQRFGASADSISDGDALAECHTDGDAGFVLSIYGIPKMSG